MTEETRAISRTRIGRVVSSKMNQTVVVRVIRTRKHSLYHKAVRSSEKFYAHDDKNECRTGDTVRIAETRPLSKLKRWRVAEIVERARD